MTTKGKQEVNEAFFVEFCIQKLIDHFRFLRIHQKLNKPTNLPENFNNRIGFPFPTIDLLFSRGEVMLIKRCPNHLHKHKM
jgi:hypothetical protein